MTLRAQLVADGPVFVDPDAFGESVTYIQGGISTVMNAVVIRGDMAAVQSVGGKSYGARLVKILIPVATLARVKERLDSVTCQARPEDLVVTTFRITKIIDQDAGMWTLEAEG